MAPRRLPPGARRKNPRAGQRVRSHRIDVTQGSRSHAKRDHLAESAASNDRLRASRPSAFRSTTRGERFSITSAGPEDTDVENRSPTTRPSSAPPGSPGRKNSAERLPRARGDTWIPQSSATPRP